MGVVVVHLGFPFAFGQLVQLMEPDRGFQHPQLVPQQQKAPGFLGLGLQRPHLPFQLGDDIPDAYQILFRPRQPALGLFFAVPEAGDARRLFKDLPPVGALDGQDLIDAALADEGIALAPQAGIHQQFMDVLEPRGFFIDEKLAFPRAVIPPCNGHFVVFHRQAVLAVVHRQRHFAIAQGLAPLGAAKDHVFHFGAPQGLGGLFAQHPADGVYDVGFARPIGPYDGGDAAAEGKHRFIRKGFKALDLQGF